MNKTVVMPKALDANLITCSFRGDLEICRLLCASFDRYVPDSFIHTLYVPAADVPLFADLQTKRRRIMTEESLLPFWFRKAPLPPRRWRKRFFLPRRNVYLTPFSLPVRGWIAQQIMKIAATLVSECEIVAHIDSDNAFVRPLSIDHLTREGKVRFFSGREVVDLPTHRPWYEAAGPLLGLPQGAQHRSGYIQNLVVWRRSVVEALTKRIEATTGHNWVVALARTPKFAEYILYGLFAEYGLGLEAAGLYAESRPLAHSCWSSRIEGPTETAAFVDALQPDHVACNIQSTSDMTLEERRHIFDLLTRRAREQDALPAKT
jgi:Family of unknown function (DUF6492)